MSLSFDTAYPHDPNAVLPYSVEWAAWLTEEVDTVASFTWIVPSGLVEHARSHGATAATIWLKSGVAGSFYLVTSRITTAGGRVDDRSFLLRCIER